MKNTQSPPADQARPAARPQPSSDPTGLPKLRAQHVKLLKDSAIRDEVAIARGYRSVADKAELERLGFKPYQCRVPSLLIPLHSVNGENGLYEIRPDSPRANKQGKSVKYERPTNSRAMLDVSPLMLAKIGDPKVPLFITEGVRKGDAAASVGLCCIALAGVWSWKGKNEKGGKTVLTDWNAVALNSGRPVYIVYDSDAAQNPKVKQAESALAGWLKSKGAQPQVIRLPVGKDGAKVGLDDYLANGGTVESLLALVEGTAKSEEVRVSGDRYMVHDGAIWHEKDSREGRVRKPLCSFNARIVEEITRDDGAERWKELIVEGNLAGGRALPRVALKGNAFEQMNWPSVEWGNEALVYAGSTTRDHLRVAVRKLSQGVTYRTVYGHFGWRKLGEEWVYLHSDGAIGANGPVAAIEVNAGEGRMHDYRLPDPLAGTDLCRAIAGSLSLLEMAPHQVMVPLLAAVYRAPLCEALPADLSLYIEGVSGSQKTELTAIAQAHYGAGFNGRNLPANWHSTANALERVAFRVKDALLTVDDFAPNGTTADIQRLHREAERLFRAVGNRAGRQRMNADATLRAEYFPRGMIVSSGEDVPAGQSLRARLFIVNLRKGDVNLARLSAAQEAAANGQLAKAMSGYVQWLAKRYPALLSEQGVRAYQRKLRDEAIQLGASHARTPDALAHLMVGWDSFLSFAEESGAINYEEREATRTLAWNALCAVARDQSGYHKSEDPVDRFLRLLQSVFESGEAHVAAYPGEGEPVDSARWGWRRERDGSRPLGERIGWADETELMLLPEAAFSAVQEQAHRQGAALPVSQRTLWKRLKECGLMAASEQEHMTVKRRIGGGSVRVVSLNLKTLSTKTGETGETGDSPPQ